mmetsp:Transcript_2267/g.6517  ORF Transcript_2267/g.6517 Transcript_2267/m.6517 type:complete len:100 (-) Transcript_2267:45-344(-)
MQEVQPHWTHHNWAWRLVDALTLRTVSHRAPNDTAAQGRIAALLIDRPGVFRAHLNSHVFVRGNWYLPSVAMVLSSLPFFILGCFMYMQCGNFERRFCA